MSDFIDRILEQAGYNKFISDDTHEMIDVLLGKSKRGDEDCNCAEKWLEPDIRPDNTDEVDNNELNNIVKYRKRYIDVDLNNDYFSVLKEAVKCPDIKKQLIMVDLGYGTAKVTTECLYNAIKDQVKNRAFYRYPDIDGLFVRIKKQLLHDNAVSFEDINKIDWTDVEWEV